MRKEWRDELVAFVEKINEDVGDLDPMNRHRFLLEVTSIQKRGNVIQLRWTDMNTLEETYSYRIQWYVLKGKNGARHYPNDVMKFVMNEVPYGA